MLRPSQPRFASLVLGAFFILQFLASPPLHADTVTLTPVQDNTLFEDVAGSLSNGVGDWTFVGRTNSDNTLRRALMQFDIAGNIPAGATINSVTLTLNMSRAKSGTYDGALHRSLAAWGEGASDASGEGGAGAPSETGDATWIHTSYATTFWSAAGGDYLGTASATLSLPTTLGPYVWSGAGLVSDVQGWLDGNFANHGWLLRMVDEGPKRSARRFDSREHPTPSNRPSLFVDYTPVTVVGACCLPSDSCVVTTEADCLLQSGTYQGDATSCAPDPCVVPTGACCFDDGTCTEETEADCLAASGTYQGDGTTCTPGLCPVVLEPFVDALPIPAAAAPVSGNQGGVATYDIAMTQFTQQLHRDLPPTTVWGYGGSFPGPTIEATSGLPVTVNWINDLRDSLGVLRTDHYLPVDLCMHGPDHAGPTPRTVVDLHGGHVPASVDGDPDSTFLPGQQVTYEYPNNQIPGTLWYHDHALGITRLNVMMGLAGFYLIRDAFEQSLGLPSGEFEIPLAIQDRSFNPDGSFSYPATWQDHFFGDKILVNGKVWPYLDVKQGKYRFRILGGSNSRAYVLTLSSGDPFTVIGNDDGLLSAPVVRDSLLVTGGERFDVIIDFAGHAPGTEIILTNSAPSPYPGTPGVGVVPNVMKFIVGSDPGHTGAVPDSLRSVTPITEGEAVISRDFHLQKEAGSCAGSIWTINGLMWDDITEMPTVGTTEIWRFINRSGVMHPMHMHLVAFQTLDRQAFTVVGQDSIVPVGPLIPPDSSMAGWKDTVPVLPGEMVRVIARFEDYLGRYAYHCHILEHEDHEMMRQFEVVAPVSTPTPTGPVALRLSPNWPNPFRSRTNISFELSRESAVTLRVFDVAGREVRTLVDGFMRSRHNTVSWDGRDNQGRSVRSGIYMFRLETASEVMTHKAVVSR